MVLPFQILLEFFHESSSFSHAGDLNRDGFDDLAISSLEEKKVYVLFGKENGFDANFDLTTLDGNNGFSIASIEPEIRLGSESRLGDSVSNAGDLNGDDFSDLIVGAPWSPTTRREYSGLGRGKAYVIFGTGEGFDPEFDLTTLDGSNGFSVTGIDIDDNLGDAVSNEGDLNGDGIDDLVISATSAEESIKFPDEYQDAESYFDAPEGYVDREIQGEVYVIFGSEKSFDAEFDLASLNGENGLAIEAVDEGEGDGFGSAIDSAGDLNGDGLADLAISSGGGTNAGYVVFGSSNLQQLIIPEENRNLVDPVVTILDDEDDRDLSPEDISLREAILYSNDGDTISFDPSLKDGTILLTSGELAIDKSLTIQGFTDSELTINGNDRSRVFNIDNNFGLINDVTINNLTITGGNAGDNGGGGIRNEENLTINNSVIMGNSAEGSGGGIYGSSTISNSTISQNSAEGSGGGISGSSTISNSTISKNQAEGNGGGIYSFDSVEIARIDNSTISGNQAEGNGGGIYAYDSVEIDNSTISGNQAEGNGGGINVRSGMYGISGTILNSTVSGNTAKIKGGGIHDGTETISNSTITGNAAPDGAGIYQFPIDSYFDGTEISSSIIAGNIDSNDVEGPDLASGGNNLIGNGDNTSAFVDRINGDIVGSADDPIDPQLGKLQDNGGSTFTHALLPESIAINTGSNPEELTTDQRGEGFPRTLFNATDIGAFEADTDSIYELPILPPEPTTKIVTILDDEDDGDLSPEDLSLREAILSSNPGDTINFDSSLSGGTITLSLGELLIDKSLAIQGLGANNLTIDGAHNSRVFNINGGAWNKIDVTIGELTISNGNATEQGGGGGSTIRKI